MPSPEQHISDLDDAAGAGTPGPRVALVGADPALAAQVAAALEPALGVVLVEAGPAAADELRHRQPDLVMIAPMPAATDLCRAVRSDPDTAQVPVLLLTDGLSSTEVTSVYDAGADDLVASPFHARELQARVHAHLRLHRLDQEAVVRERMASIGMLSAEIAHHFRNPLNFIKSGLPVVRPQVDETWMKGHARFWDTLVDSASRIELLTRDLLRLARGHRAAIVEVYDPGESLRSAARLTGATLPPDVTLELGPIAEVQVRGRSGDLNQVVLNLLDNASRAVGEHGRIRLQALQHEAGDYMITVEDSGPGVPEALRARLFEAFVTSRGAGEGTGLGLAIAARVVRDHDGTITVDTSPELGGARFEIRLPAVAPTPA